MSETTEEEKIETETVTVEVEMDVRVPTEGMFSFDPLSEQLAKGELQVDDGSIDASARYTSIRGRDVYDILAEFGSANGSGTGVFLPLEEVINAAQTAVEQSESAEMPSSEQ